jgi:hypothetical protein
MQLAAESSTTAPAKFGYYADRHQAGWNYRGNLTGSVVTIPVRPTSSKRTTCG